MKAITKQQLELIARVYECELSFDPLPVLSFGENGFEATEEYAGSYSGFRFFGDPKKQSDYIRVWNALTDPVVNKEALTVGLAEKLIGKIVRVSYCDYNEGEEMFLIVGMKKVKQKQIGQNENYDLIVRNVERDANYKFTDKIEESESTWPYEWQGIFRRGSGAERLFIEEIKDPVV